MSKGELGKGVAIRLIAAVAFGVIGGAAIFYALQMVAIFGEGMGVDARSREIYANSHMIVHLFAAACALAIGIFYYSRGWVLFAFAVAAIVLCGGYGIINMIGFTSTNRVSVAAHKEARNTAAERQYQAARADLLKQIDWLQKTASQEEGRERRRLLAEVDAKRKELSGLKPPVPGADTVLVDAQASTLGELTGTDPRKWLLALPVPLAILLFFAESFSFVIVGHMLSGIVALFGVFAAGRTKEDKKTQSGSGGSTPGEPGRFKVVHPEPPKPAAARTAEAGSPDNMRSVSMSSDAPNGKYTYEQFLDTIREDMRHGEPASSTRALHARTGWSQTSVVRAQKKEKGKLKGQMNTKTRRFAGNGGGRFHSLALG